MGVIVAVPPRPAAQRSVGPKVDHAARRQRHRLVVTWVSIMLGMALVGAVPFVTSYVSAEMLARSEAPPGPGVTNRYGQSQFGPEGVHYIESHLVASFNLHHEPRDAAFVGAAPNESVLVTPIGSVTTTVFAGPGEAHFEGFTTGLHVTTKQGEWTSLALTEELFGLGKFSQLMARVNELEQLFGWRFADAQQEELEAIVAEAVRDGEASSYDLGVGHEFGMPVHGVVECTATGACSVTSTFTLTYA